MITVKQINNEELAVTFGYCAEYVNRIHQIPDAKFDRDSKRWIIPLSSFLFFDEEFYGEVLYKTPKWQILGAQPPDYTKMYKIDKDIKVPKMKLNPYNYQDYGIRFMVDKLEKQGFIINADEVGLGKTLQSIGTMLWYMKNNNFNKIIIVCKKSLKKQWNDEIIKFTDIDKDTLIEYTSKDKKSRKKVYEKIKNSNKAILITNHHTLMNDTEELKELNFNMCIIDEVHVIKNRLGKMNKAACEVCKNIDKKILLTGTPIMSQPDDLYGIIQIADKKYFGKWKDFKEKYIKEDRTGFYVGIVGYMNLDELREKTQEIIIRRTEHEVDLDLPEALEPKAIFVEVDTTQKKIISAINKEKKELLEKLDNLNAQEDTEENIQDKTKCDALLKGLIASEQAIADDPRLFLMSKSYAIKKKFGPFIPSTYEMSNKTNALIDLVEEILENKEKILIFTKFERCCRLLKSDLEKSLNIKVLLYTGDVSDEERNNNISLFKNDDDYNVLILTNAGAEGLNLQVARHQINFDQPDTNAIKVQRMGRIRRAGSKFDRVYTYDLITEKTKDEERLDNINKQKMLSESLIEINEQQAKALKEAMKS